MKVIGGEIASQDLNDNFGELEANMISKGFLSYDDAEDFGALGDGVVDDTASFQLFVDESSKSSIRLKSGTYVINNLSVTRSVKFLGEKGTIIKAKTSTDGQTLNVLTADSLDFIEFHNVEFDGSSSIANSSSEERDNLFKITNVENVEFHNCEFHNYSSGGGGTLPQLLWERDYIMGVIHNCNKVTIHNSEFYSNFDEQILISSDDYRTEVDIQRNRAHDNLQSLALFILVNLKKGYVAHNECINNKRTFVNLITPNVTVEHNYVKGTTSRGVATEYLNLSNNDNCIVRHNHFENCDEGGTNLSGENVHVYGNTYINCGGGIQISGQPFKDDDSSVKAINPLAPSGSAYRNWKGIYIKDNKFIDCYGTGFDNLIRIRPEVYIDTNGVYNYQTVERIDIHGNYSEKQSKPFTSKTCVHITRGYDISIMNNTFSDPANYMIEFHTEVKYVEIKHNKFRAEGNYDILMYFTNFNSSVKTQYGLDYLAENILFEQNEMKKNPKIYFHGVNGNGLGSIKDMKIIGNNNFACRTEAYTGSFHNPILTKRELHYESGGGIPSRVTFYKGDMIYFTPTAGMPLYKVCTSGGTTGTMNSGVTASGSSGSYNVTVNSSIDVREGYYLTIGNTNHWVVTKSGNTLTVTPPLSTSITNVPVSFKTPSILDSPVL
jgi:hypothetical protein